MEWIKCSERMPDSDEFVQIWPLPDFGVELHVGQYDKFNKKGAGGYAEDHEDNDGIELHLIDVAHWMPLPRAPSGESRSGGFFIADTTAPSRGCSVITAAIHRLPMLQR